MDTQHNVSTPNENEIPEIQEEIKDVGEGEEMMDGEWSENGDEDWEDLSDEENLPQDGRLNNPASYDPMLMGAYIRKSLRQIPNELPEAVKVLEGNSGELLYLIGTAHFSKKSCEEVEKLIQMVQPDFVVLELCNTRINMLTMDEEYYLREAERGTLDKFKDYYQQKGMMSGVVALMLHLVSDHITKQLGTAPGGEFRTAAREASKVPGCRVLLGDRPIEITMKRILASLSFIDKLRIGITMLKDLSPISSEDVEKLKEKDMLEQVLEEFMSEFPKLVEAILSERDIFLTHNLQKTLAQKIMMPDGGLVPPVVVGVVGLAHRAGIEQQFHTEITDTQLKQVMEIPAPSKIGRMAKLALKGVLIGSVLYATWRFVAWSGLYEKVVWFIPVDSFQNVRDSSGIGI